MLARAIVDRAAIRANAAAMRMLVVPARLAAVIKSNAYGHGLVEVGRTLAEDVDRLCVYELDEALALRAASVRARIHVLGPIPPARLDEALANAIEITLWDAGTYLADLECAARAHGDPAIVHAKIDTGVTRLGMSIADAPTMLKRYHDSAAITMAGVFSHLAAAEELDAAFTDVQLERFLGVTRLLGPEVDRHIAASAAAMLFTRTRLSSVRAGIAMYGLWPSAQTKTVMEERGLILQPALRWESELVLVHDVEPGTSVGYGRTYRANSASRIGVLPIGYAEGIPRAASNRGFFLIGGVKCPIAGRVCMNMTMVDVTDVPNAHPGMTVTLVGADGDARITLDDWGTWSNTINYEMTARLPANLPRTYVN